MTTPEPGERRPDRASARLDRAPSERYVAAPLAGTRGGEGASAQGGNGARGPLVAAIVATVLGAAMLVLLGGALASTGGLIFVAGVAGAATGLFLAGAAVADDGPPAMARGTVVRLAVALSVVGTLAGALGMWAFARMEGGALDPVAYLWETSGLLVPSAILVGALGAAWGAANGPVRS